MLFRDKFFRCNCPVTSALDIVGDKWTLVIIKLMLLEHKKTFKEFSECAESIAPSILSNRLKRLEEFRFIEKTELPNNRKTKYYLLTKTGLSLTPIIMELTLWSHHNITPIEDQEILNLLGKEEMCQLVIDSYKSKTASL